MSGSTFSKEGEGSLNQDINLTRLFEPAPQNPQALSPQEAEERWFPVLLPISNWEVGFFETVFLFSFSFLAGSGGRYPRKKREYLVYAPLTTQQRVIYDRIMRKSTNVVPPGGTDAAAQSQREASPDEMAMDGRTTEERVKKNRRAKTTADYRELSDAQFFKKMQEAPSASSSSSSTPPPAPSSSSSSSSSITTPAGVINPSQQNIMMQLRKICDRPYYFQEYEVGEDLVTSAGKLLLMDRLVPRLIERGHKMLVFSQFTSMLDILEDYFTFREMEYCRIDGSVSHDERQSQISRFNHTPEIKIFLLSTRAGGLGINLTSADTCIIYDSDWVSQSSNSLWWCDVFLTLALFSFLSFFLSSFFFFLIRILKQISRHRIEFTELGRPGL